MLSPKLSAMKIFTAIIGVPPYSATGSKTHEKYSAPNLLWCIGRIKMRKGQVIHGMVFRFYCQPDMFELSCSLSMSLQTLIEDYSKYKCKVPPLSSTFLPICSFTLLHSGSKDYIVVMCHQEEASLWVRILRPSLVNFKRKFVRDLVACMYIRNTFGILCFDPTRWTKHFWYLADLTLPFFHIELHWNKIPLKDILV